MNDHGLKEGRDYAILERANSPCHSIQLLTGTWSGVIYNYGQVRILENPNNTATLSFQYTVEKASADYSVRNLNENQQFRTHIGDVLVDILSQVDGKIGKNGKQLTTHDT